MAPLGHHGQDALAILERVAPGHPQRHLLLEHEPVVEREVGLEVGAHHGHRAQSAHQRHGCGEGGRRTGRLDDAVRTEAVGGGRHRGGGILRRDRVRTQ